MAYTGKGYIVTGGASGLGEATVRRLAALGAKVAILDRDVARGQALVTELGGGNVIFVEFDATVEESCKAAVETPAKKFGNLWGAVNCAGGGAAVLTVDKKGEPHSSKAFDFVIKLNLYGTFNICKHAASVMAKNTPDEHGLRGCLINCASVAAFDGQKGQIAYAAAKGAVTQMTLPMARDLGVFGIRVNTIAPGIMSTPMMAGGNPKVHESLLKSVVAPKRLGLPVEFALLATQIFENTYVNGEVIRLDGGIRMGYENRL